LKAPATDEEDRHHQRAQPRPARQARTGDLRAGHARRPGAALRAEFGDAAELEFFQSNHEGELIDRIAALADAKFDGIVINGGALTHTSVALRDALLGAHLPAVEVHISNIYKREEFRHESLTAPACLAVISGPRLGGLPGGDPLPAEWLNG
jgi:hypothetical protein